MTPLTKAAQKATDAAETQIQAIYDAVTANRFVNGYGVYTDRGAVESRLTDIEAAAQRARRALREVERWPYTDADYGEV